MKLQIYKEVYIHRWVIIKLEIWTDESKNKTIFDASTEVTGGIEWFDEYGNDMTHMLWPSQSPDLIQASFVSGKWPKKTQHLDLSNAAHMALHFLQHLDYSGTTSSTSGAAESTVEDLLPVASEEVQPAKVNDNSLI